MITPENLKPIAHTTPDGGTSAAKATAHVEGAGAAFRALLERLERSAMDLNVASDSIDDPRQLGEAVKTARVSVEEALLAGDDLLEAYRAAQAQGSTEDSNTSTTPTN